MEITILSAQGLKKTSSSSTLIPHQIKPLTTLTTTATGPPYAADGDNHRHVYKTSVDDEGGPNPTWGDKFKLPNVDANFLYQRYSCIYLKVYTKNFMGGNSLLGWCQIPSSDILDGLSPAGAVRRLSYRLRNKDGSRGHGVVNVAVKLEGNLLSTVKPPRMSVTGERGSPEIGPGYTVIGVPVEHIFKKVDFFRA